LKKREELKQWHQCLEMLGDAKVDEHGNANTSGDCNVVCLDKDGEDREINISSDNYRLTCDEEKILLSTLQFAPGDGWLSTFYSCLIKKYEKENIVEEKFSEFEGEHYAPCSMDASFTHSLKNNTDLLTCKADHYHQCGDYQKRFDVTTMLLERDSFHI
jgi:anaphase-promoting complex subunit 6